jgi:hypothetical protein
MKTIEQAAHRAMMERIENDWRYHGLPQRMWGGMKRYLENGIPPGDFLTAIICNDLCEAVSRADDENAELFRAYVRFLYNCVPGGAWHTHDNFKAWCASHGFIGQAEKTNETI